MKVIVTSYEGLKKTNKRILELTEAELETMLEKDYQRRLKEAVKKDTVKKLNAGQFFDRLNKDDRNSWERHYYKVVDLAMQNNDKEPLDHFNLLGSHTTINEIEKHLEYETTCAKVRQLLKPEQAKMIIAICIDGMTVKEYAAEIGDTLKNTSKRFVRIKKKMKELWK